MQSARQDNLSWLVTNVTTEHLCLWLDEKLHKRDVNQITLFEFIRRNIDALLIRGDLTLAQLVSSKFLLEKILSSKISSARSSAYKKCYRKCFFSDSSKVTIDINNFKRVNVLNEILSDKEELLYVKNETVISRADNEKNLVKLKSTTLDKLCEMKKIIPEIMKIDVHGAEGKVLFGSNEILKKYAKVILLELHTSNYLKKFSDGLSKKEIIFFLIDLGFRCYLVSSFRDHDLKKNNENYEYKEINKENFELVFFDRDKTDQFVFCIKNNLDIKSFKLFN